MDKKALTASEICRIIKQCRDVGVLELEFGDLRLKFSGDRTLTSPELGYQASEVIEKLEPGPAPIQNGTEVGLYDEQLAEDAIHAQLLIDDPRGFEKLQIYEGLEKSG